MNFRTANNVPSSKIVLPYFGTAAIFWVIALIFTLVDYSVWTNHFYNSSILGITHLIALGFVTMTIIGAMHQLIPVIFQTKLMSEIISIITYLLLLFGTLGLFFSFYFQFPGMYLILSGISLAISLLLFCINIIGTYFSNIQFEIEKIFVLVSIFWLFVTVLAGLSMALNRNNNFLDISQFDLLKIHVHAGIIGWFLQLIIGISSVLLPMFLLNHNLKKKYLILSFILINISLLGGIVCVLLQIYEGVAVSICSCAIGILSYLYFIFDLFRNRLKRKLDTGMKTTMLSFIIVAIPLIIAFLNQFLNEEISRFTFSGIFVLTFIIGFVSTLILGQTFKTLPFIVWLKVFKPFIGKEKTPLPKDLYLPKIQLVLSIVHPCGFTIFLFGILFSKTQLIVFGIGLILIAAILYLINVFKIILFKRIVP